MNQEKRTALFRKWAIRFQKNTLHFFQKGLFVFFTDSYKVVGIAPSSIGESS